MNLSNYLVLFMIGCILLEFAGRSITHLEADGDYGSPLYLVFGGIITLGLTLALTSILTILKEVEKQLKETHGYKVKRTHVDLSLFIECKKVMVFIYRKFKQFVKP